MKGGTTPTSKQGQMQNNSEKGKNGGLPAKRKISEVNGETKKEGDGMKKKKVIYFNDRTAQKPKVAVPNGTQKNSQENKSSILKQRMALPIWEGTQ